MSSSQDDNSESTQRKQRKIPSPEEIQSIFSSSTTMSENSKTNRGKITTLSPVKQQKHKKQLDLTSDDISEITNSEYHESLYTSKSDIHSYRDKLKNRFQKIKQTGKTKSNRRNKSDKTFRSHANNIITLNRSIDLMKKENIAIESQFRSYKRCNSKESSENLIPKSERYQFFCEALPDSWVLDRFPLEQIEEDISGCKDKTNKDSDDSVMVEFKKAEHRGEDVDKAEADLFWTPSRIPLRQEEKVVEQPRIFEEEGLYVSGKNKIPKNRLNILEQRLLSIDDQRWFDASGQLILSENPYSKTSFRPDEYSTPSKLELEFQGPKIASDLTSLNSIFVPQDDILEINIHSVKFKHHPLFSTEHVLQEKLIEFYDVYREYTACNKLERLQKKLDGLRKAVHTLKENIHAAGDGFHDENITIQTYQNQIKKIRKELLKISKLYRENLKMILNTWKSIKKVRAMNKFSSTSIKLFIQKEQTDAEKEEADYQAMFDETLDELILEQESEHRLKMVEYKKALNMWKRRVEEDQDEDLKPLKPSKDIDLDEIRSKLEVDFQKCFKTPGEPMLHFNITYDNEISKVTDDSKEILRRNAVSGTKIFLKFFCNNIEVCKSKMKPMTDTFVCHFEEYFSLKLTNVPESVLMEIYEQTNTLVKRKVAEIKLKIPMRNIRLGHSKITEDSFLKEEYINYKHNGVGSSVTVGDLLTVYNIPVFLDDDTLQTSGFITFSIGWDAKTFDVADPEFSLNEDILDSNGSIDIEKLHRWIEVAQPDPQDPKYSIVFDFLNECLEKPDRNSNKKKYFRCDPYAFPLEIFTKADIEENIRFKLLELRDKNVPEFVGMTVPNRIKEIPTNVFSTYERRLAEENNQEYLQEDEYEYEINTHRSQGRKYIRQMHTKIFQMCRNSENNLTFEDIVNEKTIPFIQLFISNFIYNFLNWFKIQPALSKPLPSIKFEAQSTNILESKSPSKITICLKAGLNIPNRSEKPRRKFSRSQSVDAESNDSQVKSFVEVCYEQFISFSSASIGTNPTWNDEIQFPLEINNVDHLNPNILNGSITINLYDDLSQEEDTNTEDIKQTHFLGSVQVPVSAIAESQKLEGLFLVKTPAMLLGYEKSEDAHQSTRSTTVPQTYENYTYINMKISIDPNIPKLSPDMESLPSSEPPYLRDHIMEWNMKFNTEHNQRKFLALAIDSNGKTVCVIRYIKSLEPPQINADGFDITPDQCARYVSMIPFTDSNKFYQNIWLSTEQMLKLGIGSVIDHAIALICYFLSLNVEAWLLLGFGLPHGSMGFVLVREYTNESTDPLHYVYDVTTGFKYNVTDPCCPLKKIYCVINDNNLWANVQRGDDIATTRFDFSRRFDWSPLFNKHITSPSNSIQQKLIYVSTFDTQKIQSSIEKKLKKKLAKLRKHDQTVWNHYMCNVLKNSMSKFEVNMMHGKTYMEIPEIDEMSKNFKITGCLVNLPFYSVGGIVEKVINTKLHQVDGNFEFAAGVHVHAYPNQVISVWAVVLRIFRKS